MSVVLSSGIRKNGGTRICLPRPPSVTDYGIMEYVPRLMGEPAALPCAGFTRCWMDAKSVQRVLALWAACPSETEAHQLACRVILALQAGAIEVIDHD